MRILSTQPPRELPPTTENPVWRQVAVRPDSIECLKAPTWIIGKVKAIYRGVLDFFRGILSRFIPIQSYTPVSAKQIDYQRIIREERTIYRILVDDVSTDNEISYSKNGEAIIVTDISFPDKAMRAHIGMIFGEILEKEGAKCFSTNVFDFAKLLWNCGYVAEGTKICYYPDSENVHQEHLGSLVDLAKERHEAGTLPEGCGECVKRISSELESSNLMGSVFASFVDLGPPKKNLLLSDVLHLMDCLNIDKIRGMQFEFTGRGWAKFHKSE